MAARIGNALLGLDAIRMTRELGPVAPVRPVRRVTTDGSGTEPSRAAAAVVEFSAQAIALARTAASYEPAAPVYAAPVAAPERDASGNPEREAGGGLRLLGAPEPSDDAEPGPPGAPASPASNAPDPATATPASDAAAEEADPSELSPEQEAVVVELKQRDAEVRAHENAHRSAGGRYAGSPSYTFQVGPDGRRYAIGGEVPLDVGPVKGDPRATLQKMETIVRAALAPAQPSSTDYRIAANARAHMNAARMDLARERSESMAGSAPVEPAAAELAPPGAADATSTTAVS